MEDSLQQKIFDAAPVFFRNKDLPCTKTCMCWGIECGDGWYEPLLEFAKRAEVINELLKPYGCCIVADQIKSKWADIRVYWSLVNLDGSLHEELNEHDEFVVKTIDRLFEYAVDNLGLECERTCELCGSREDYNNDILTCGSWLTHQCRSCAQKREREKGSVMFFRDGFNFLNPFCDGTVKYGNGIYGCFMGLYYSQLCPEHKVIFGKLKSSLEVQEIAFNMGLCREDDEAIEVMKRILPCKFEDSKNHALFFSTSGLNLVYSNQVHENFWGSCICNECKDKEHFNHYGRLLMELRDGMIKKDC